MIGRAAVAVMLAGVFAAGLWLVHVGAARQDAWCRSRPPAAAAAFGCTP